VIDALYAKLILDDADMEQLLGIPERRTRTRMMLTILNQRGHPEAFVVLRQALVDGLVYQHLVDDIDACARKAPDSNAGMTTVYGSLECTIP